LTQGLGRAGSNPIEGLFETSAILATQQAGDGRQTRLSEIVGSNDSLGNASVTQIESSAMDARPRHAAQGQLNDFNVGLETGITIKFSADLQRFSGGPKASRTRVQNAAAIAQTSDALPVQQMGIDTRDLRGHVGTHPQSTT